MSQGDPPPLRPRKIEVEPPTHAEVVSVGSGREQEQSIRARKQLLFEDEELPARPGGDDAAFPTKSFPEYLRTTPAAPLSGSTRALLWGAGLIVALLFVASLVKRGSSSPGKGRSGTPAATAKP